MISRFIRRIRGAPSPEDGLAETLKITIFCARRCAYDLAHAADFIPENGWQREWGERYARRATEWQQLFSSGTSMKEYRLKLYDEIDSQARTIEKLREELRALGHSGYHGQETPF